MGGIYDGRWSMVDSRCTSAEMHRQDAKVEKIERYAVQSVCRKIRQKTSSSVSCGYVCLVDAPAIIFVWLELPAFLRPSLFRQIPHSSSPKFFPPSFSPPPLATLFCLLHLALPALALHVPYYSFQMILISRPRAANSRAGRQIAFSRANCLLGLSRG